MSDTFTTEWQTATRTIESGIPNFLLYAAEEWPRDGIRLFYVSVPYALTRNGITGRRPLSNTKPTRFGRTVCANFKRVPGVVPVLNRDIPHLLELSVAISMEGKLSNKPWVERHGLCIPQDACIALQAAIEHHRPSATRFVEYFRRLF